MSTFTPAETLRQHRPLLLAMEAIGWFHMAGKARAEFLRRHGSENNGYNERQWHQQETPPFPWDNLLEWVRRLYGAGIPNNAWPGSFADFTEKHAGRNTGMLGLLQAAHGVVSGVEKNLPGSTSHYLNQTVLHMWLSSPWGHPKRNLLADPPEILTPQGWQQLVKEIRRILEEACRLGASHPPADVPAWRRWREQAIGEDSFIRRAFLSTLAETRLPNNDVTLWDQSYVAAALFKSAVAGALLNHNHPWTDKNIKGKVRWRLLTVAIGADHYEARSVKIGDWTGAQGTIEEFFRRVAELVEVDLAVGSLLYRDDSVVVFSFPGERFDEEEQERQRRNDPNFQYDEDNFALWLQNWKKWLQDEVERIACDLDLETPPHVRLSAPTRSLVPLVQEREEALKVVAIPVHKRWDVRWTTPSEARGHVCPVCRVRLNGDPTSKTRPCRMCRERRHHRRDAWVQGHLGYDTIWFEEVADRNGRLALVTFSLDVESWLSGERVDSLRAQAISEWFKYNKKVARAIENQTKRWRTLPLHERLTQYFKKRIDRPPKQISTDGILRSIIPNLEEEFSDPSVASSSWERIYNRLVEDRSVAPSWNSSDTIQNAKWFVFQSFRKLPSPGRVYRFWREAEEFFCDLLREFRQIAARSANPWRVRRLVLVPQNKNGWRDLTLYDGRWRGQQISLVYIQSLGGFVTASNLARLLQPEEAKAVLQDEVIPLEEEDRFGRIRDMQVETVRDLGKPHSHLGVYAPVIPVEISPLRFRVLVPLEAASECVDLAASWWKERFARVWDRLPLRVGVVAFPRTLPYQAVIEATRNLEDALVANEKEEKKVEIWQVEEVECRAGVTALRLKRKDGRSTLRVVPTIMPDGREDVFYPYVEVEDTELRFPRDFRHPYGRVFRHVADLRPGDGIRVFPARIAALFMESTAARFADWDVRYLEEWKQMRETWGLLRRVAPSQTALQHLRSELGHVEEAWRTPEGAPAASEQLRQDTYRALLVHHLECRGTALDALTAAAVQDELTWSLDWHLSVLKE
ncbi:CRISPR-associated protein Csx11 [Rhodothermus profundi]|uniref:CRISPR-associated protein, Csx11 family n=1 Tax=Rhodothermus profundi TaxID=633813 RepID=A0A1M6UFK5_9BACT|nr:CRISPR-associated protein Csx11 [Rhodothermus profundi]SHK67966.1 CRISPR-associated protein, Csx11 family [Rhodothermus profundi]